MTPKDNKILLFIVFSLVLVGIYAIFSSTSVIFPQKSYSQNFFHYEFQDTKTPKGLVKKIIKDDYGIEISDGEPINILNKLLKNPALYEKILAKKTNYKPSEEILAIIAQYHISPTEYNLKKLNRQCLEEVYPLDTPTNISKTSKNKKSIFYYSLKQSFALLMGIILMLYFSMMPVKHLKIAMPILLSLSFIMLLLVFTPLGVTVGGATRWLNLWIFNFQPSELAKLAMVLFLAWYMSLYKIKGDDFLKSITQKSLYNKHRLIVSFIIPISIMILFQIILAFQKDFGACISLLLITLFMLLISGIKLRYILYLCIASLPVITILIITYPHRIKRILAFLDPWKYSGTDGYQLIQSLIGLGSGELTGVGFINGKQKLNFLPEIHTDFIFSLIGEEGGFIFAGIIVILFFLLFIVGQKISQKTEDIFLHYLGWGLILMITIQSLINFFVVTGLAPTKGLPLPFISYGGSALIINMMAIGMLLNISKTSLNLNQANEYKNKLIQSFEPKDSLSYIQPLSVTKE